MGLEKQGENLLEREVVESAEVESAEKNGYDKEGYWEEEINRRKALKRIGKIGAGAATGSWALREIYKMSKEEPELRKRQTAKRRVEQEAKERELAALRKQEEEWAKTMAELEKDESEFLDNEIIEDRPKTKEQIKQTKKAISRLKEKKEKSEAERLADIYLEVFHRLKNKKEFFPPEVFTSVLFIAQQLQESRYEHDAKSHKGAVGVMQNRPISIKDVGRFVFKLKRKGKINFFVPKELSDREVKEIMPLLARNPDYSRAFGKLYMMQLFDPRYGYGVAEAEWKQHNIKAVQKKVLAAYNAGYKRIKYRPEWHWPREARRYYKNIFRLMDLIKETEKEIKRIEGFGRWPGGLIKKDAMDYALMKLTLEAAQAKWRWGQRQIIRRNLEKIKTAVKDKGAPLGENDLRELFKA